MNRIGVETLQRRLDATRRARDAEKERLNTITVNAAKIRSSITGMEQDIRDLEEALSEATTWIRESSEDPLAAPCPSCGAKTGESCRSTTGEELYEPHYTRGAPS